MNDKYFYPKNGHTYIIEGEVRMKDISTGEWYDAVLYKDHNGRYVREKEDFYKRFQSL